VRGPPGEGLLAHGRYLTPQMLSLVDGPGQALLQIADLAVASCYEVVNLAAAVTAHLHLKFFMEQIRQEVTVFIHGITRIFGPKVCENDVRV